MNSSPSSPADTEEQAWSRGMLLCELRKPAPAFRWDGMTPYLWPMAAVFGVISYRGFTGHGLPAVNFACALLCFNFAVSAIVCQATAPLRRKIAILAELVDQLSEASSPSAGKSAAEDGLAVLERGEN